MRSKIQLQPKTNFLYDYLKSKAKVQPPQILAEAILNQNEIHIINIFDLQIKI